MTLRCPQFDRFATADVMARQSCKKSPAAIVQALLRSDVLQSRMKLVHPLRNVMPWSPETGTGISINNFLDATSNDSLLIRNPVTQDNGGLLPTLDDVLFEPETGAIANTCPLFLASESFSMGDGQRSMVSSEEQARLTDPASSLMMELSAAQPDIAEQALGPPMIVSLDDSLLVAPLPPSSGDLLSLAFPAAQAATSPALSDAATCNSMPSSNSSPAAPPSSASGNGSSSSDHLLKQRSGVTKRRRGRGNQAASFGSGSDSDPAEADTAEAASSQKAAALQKAMRIEKNRAAARVSNARRKERNLNLRRDLALVRDRLETLREKERRLREENALLKAQVSSVS